MQEKEIEQIEESIMDSMLEEVVGGKTPPDLTQRILAAWEAEKRTGSPAGDVLATDELPTPNIAARPLNPSATTGKIFTAEVVRSAEQARTTNSEARPTGASRKQAKVRPIASGSRAVRRAKSHSSRSTNRFSLLLTAAAAALVCLGGWAAVTQFNQDDAAGSNSAIADGSASQPSVVPVNTADPNGDIEVAPGPTLAEDDSASDAAKGPSAEQVPLDDLPFADETQIAQVPSTTESREIKEAGLLSDAAIVEQLDALLSRMWQESGLATRESIGTAAWLERLSNRWEEPSLASRLSSDAATSRLDLASELTSAPEFAEVWAGYFSSRLLSGLPIRGNAKANIEQVVAERAQAEGFGQVAKDLLAGDSSDDSEAKAATLAFLASAAGGGNHNLVRRIGSHFLGGNLGCVRCHDGIGQTATSGLARADGITTQQGYWSLVGMLRGIDVTFNREKRTRELVDRQSEVFASDKRHTEFFDLLDGRMKATQPALPDGRLYATMAGANAEQLPRAVLADWIAESPEFDMAVTNQVWAMVVGQPLFDASAEFDLAAAPRRTELLSLLASQYRAAGRDVGKLAAWIAASQASDRPAADLSIARVVSAADEELQETKLALRVFAAAIPTKQTRTFEQNVSVALKLRAADAATNIALAQRDLPNAKRRPNRTPSSELPADFVLGADHVSTPNARYVDRLLAADRLSWKDQVQHVVLLEANNRYSDRVLQLANTLLQRHNGNSRAALLDLLWAVQNTL